MGQAGIGTQIVSIILPKDLTDDGGYAYTKKYANLLP